ncbi:hypothetical protein HZS_5733 [Henneguya salminicola]|nr:hypothetical protein HZS_5733 [Henneguya salminicola]
MNIYINCDLLHQLIIKLKYNPRKKLKKFHISDFNFIQILQKIELFTIISSNLIHVGIKYIISLLTH